jgi:hypothetical protein
MADFMAGEPDDLSAYLAGHAHRPGDDPGEERSLGDEGHPGGEPDGAGGQRPAGECGPGEERRLAAAGRPGESGDGQSHANAEGGGRDERLADFAQHRCGDTARPNAWHVMVLNDLTGAGDRCPGATDNEALGLMGRWKAAESWAAARMLGVVRELIRRRAVPGKGMATAGLPWEWERDLEHEVAAQLRVSLVAAGKLLHFAWSLEARLPQVGKALAEDRLDPGQAKMIVTETDALLGEKAAAAEELILAGLDACKTWADLARLVQRAVCTVDPDGARRRREEAERASARVRLWRESSGACALAGHALPADEALAAYGQVEARAQHYRQQGIREYIDLLRVMAYLDLLNGTPAADRIARWTAEAAANAAAGAAQDAATEGAGEAAGTTPDPGRTRPGPRGTGSRNGGTTGGSAPGHGGPRGDAPGGRAPGNGGPRGGAPDPANSDTEADSRPGADDSTGDPGNTYPGADDSADDPGNTRPGADDSTGDPGDTRPGGRLPGPESRDPAASGPQAGPELRARVNLTVPMGTAAGHDDRPGEAWELGALDPALARQLLAAAARSPGSEFCVTVTDEHGYAVGHGCCQPATPRNLAKPARLGNLPNSAKHRVNPAATAPPGPAPPAGHATFTRRDGPGPPGGYGSWTLTLPGTGATYTVDLKPVPTHACDHAYQSPGHDPSAWLRHIVQVRDGKCSFPSCGRHARESDFEHATPHQDGGKTCACNCHACSRSCHQVKQRPGWSVTAPKPGWHQWTTPTGRSYVQGPWQYPA